MNFAKLQLGKVAVATVVLCAFALPASAQELRIGVVNVPLLMDRAPQTKSAMDALQEEFAPRQREILAKQTELRELVEKAQKDGDVMSETERGALERSVRDLQREVTRLDTEFREDLNLRQNEELGKLQRSLLTEVQAYAQGEGYDIVVGDGVLYASNAANITEEVLRAIEASYQATSSR
ncbi:MAG: OmpH family outer membrane protein [Pseudomonadota bacterium]